jgi:2-methylisocitrate lyase-like PEP mutase family enzyme
MTAAFATRHRALRALLASGRTIAAPGASDTLSARQIEAAGFECVYIGSYATAASRLGLPDTGLLSLQDMVGQARGIVDAVNIPVIADAEGGFNDAANIWRTVRDFERAGVSAIHIEDRAYGKHAEVPQRLHPIDTVASRIRAAVDAREDPDFIIVARSDAYWVSKDLDDTVARLNAYAEAGADMVFPTMLPPPLLAQVRARLTRPVMVVDSPGYTLADEAAAGAAIVLYYGFSLLVQYQAVQQALATFRRTGDAGAVPGLRENVAQFEQFIGYAEFTERTRKYGAG